MSVATATAASGTVPTRDQRGTQRPKNRTVQAKCRPSSTSHEVRAHDPGARTQIRHPAMPRTRYETEATMRKEVALGTHAGRCRFSYQTSRADTTSAPLTAARVAEATRVVARMAAERQRARARRRTGASISVVTTVPCDDEAVTVMRGFLCRVPPALAAFISFERVPTRC